MSVGVSIPVNLAADTPSFSLPRIHDRPEPGPLCIVYGTITPIALDGFDAGDVFYIGVTKRSLESRLKWHLYEYGNARKHAFIRKLRALGAKPTITPLLVVTEADADRAEQDMVQRYSARGPLLNDPKRVHPYTAPIKAPVWLRDGGVA